MLRRYSPASRLKVSIEQVLQIKSSPCRKVLLLIDVRIAVAIGVEWPTVGIEPAYDKAFRRCLPVTPVTGSVARPTQTLIAPSRLLDGTVTAVVDRPRPFEQGN